jgi:hypothetical protein
MTPKEKAEELVLKYLRIDNNTKEWFNKHIAKQCALIAVDEILNNNNKIPGNVDGLHTIENTSYWQQVKQEISKQ